jgi:hypothetical protein
LVALYHFCFTHACLRLSYFGKHFVNLSFIHACLRSSSFDVARQRSKDLTSALLVLVICLHILLICSAFHVTVEPLLVQSPHHHRLLILHCLDHHRNYYRHHIHHSCLRHHHHHHHYHFIMFIVIIIIASLSSSSSSSPPPQARAPPYLHLFHHVLTSLSFHPSPPSNPPVCVMSRRLATTRLMLADSCARAGGCLCDAPEEDAGKRQC